MSVHRARLQHKQGFLFRLVDVENELFAMAAVVARAHALGARRSPEAARAGELADLFCRNARRKVARLFRELWRNDDAGKYRAGVAVVEGVHDWIREGTLAAAEHSAPAPAAGEPELESALPSGRS
jgi:hypothetical protein